MEAQCAYSCQLHTAFIVLGFLLENGAVEVQVWTNDSSDEEIRKITS